MFLTCSSWHLFTSQKSSPSITFWSKRWWTVRFFPCLPISHYLIFRTVCFLQLLPWHVSLVTSLGPGGADCTQCPRRSRARNYARFTTVDHVVGWLLRVIYLQLTGSPNATWIASCTLMHMIETANPRIEPSGNDPILDADSSYSPQTRKRIYYIAQLFNTWISYDYGRSRVIPRGAS